MNRERRSAFTSEEELDKVIAEEEKGSNEEFQYLVNEIANLQHKKVEKTQADLEELSKKIDLLEKNLKDAEWKEFKRASKKEVEEEKPQKYMYGGKKKSKRNKRMGRKSRKLMCPKNCCGVSVTKCGCPKSCRHCNCHEIKRLRKKLRKKSCKKSKRKKRRKRKKTKRRRR